MTACHLVTDSDLSLLCYIYLSKLHYSVRKFVTDLDLVENPLVPCCCFLVCDAVVVDEVSDKSISVLVAGPLA